MQRRPLARCCWAASKMWLFDDARLVGGRPLAMQGSAKGLAPSDERPVPPWARAAFYLSLLLLMHTEFSFGRGAKFVPVVWPFHESELALSAALHWCHAPRDAAPRRRAGRRPPRARCCRAPRAAPPCAASAGDVGGLALAAAASVAPHRLGRLAPAVAPPASSSSRRSSKHRLNHRWLLPRSPPPRSPPTTRRRRPPRARALRRRRRRHLRRRRARQAEQRLPRRAVSPAAALR